MKNRLPLTLAQAQMQIDGSFIAEPLETRAIEVLEEALGATAWVRTAGADGRILYREVPDHAIRLVAAVKVIEWRRGKATQQINLATTPAMPRDVVSTADTVKMLRANPVLMDKIMTAMIKAAKVREAGGSASFLDAGLAPFSAPESEGGPR